MKKALSIFLACLCLFFCGCKKNLTADERIVALNTDGKISEGRFAYVFKDTVKYATLYTPDENFEQGERYDMMMKVEGNVLPESINVNAGTSYRYYVGGAISSINFYELSAEDIIVCYSATLDENKSVIVLILARAYGSLMYGKLRYLNVTLTYMIEGQEEPIVGDYELDFTVEPLYTGQHSYL